jgi:CHAT domain-containing protein/tetratricopeptide (TPR) repeat protein
VDAKHLTSDEIQLLVQSRLNEQSQGDTDVSETIRCHADSCEICGRLVSMRVDFHRRLNQLRTSTDPSRTPRCADGEVLWALACGLLPPETASTTLQHVTGCDFCSQAFRVAMEEFTGEPTPQEIQLARTVEFSQSAKLPELALKLASPSREPEKPAGSPTYSTTPFRFWRPTLALSTAVLLLVVSYLTFQSIRGVHPGNAERLLAQAYTSARPFELRLRGADFAPLRIQRGSQRSQTQRPPELLEAEALIGRKLNETPDDPEWLRARGQADLLDGRYSSAVDALQRARDLRPNSFELETDLATALFERAEADNSVADYSTAADLLSKALRQNPDDEISLFNRALVLERLFLFDQADDDWEHYLKIDPAGGWASEARQHLEDLKRKREHKQKISQEPLLSPDQISSIDVFRDPTGVHKFDQRIEEYLSIALRQWIPPTAANSQLPGLQPASADTLSAAIQKVDFVLTDRHQDTWLHEFLSARSSPHFSTAFEALRDAIRSSERADYASALQYAFGAERLYRLDGNTAGVARANFERVYALQFSNDGLGCAQEARKLQDSLRLRQYLWIRQQAMIEEGICQNLLGEFGGAAAILKSAETQARTSHYPVTMLRALTMHALVLWDSGRSTDAWQGLCEAAKNCWSEYCSDQTLYSVYANMDNFAEDSMLWHVQMFAARQAVATSQADPDFLMRAVEHSRLAGAAMLAGAPSIAEENFKIASRLLAQAPQSDVTNNYEAGINIDLAKLALIQGDHFRARAYIERATVRVPHITDYYILADFFLTQAKLEQAAKQPEQSESSVRWAIAIAERQLASLPSQSERFVWSRQSSEVYRELIAAELRKGNNKAALEAWEWYLAAPRRMARLEGLQKISSESTNADVMVLNRTAAPAPPLPLFPPVEKILARLQGQTLISYALLSNRLGAWILDDRGTSFRWLAQDATEVLHLSRSFVEHCSNPAADALTLKRESSALYEVLIAPFDERLAHGTVLLIDGEPAILNLPFPALADRKGKYLLQSLSISVIPGTYLLPETNSATRIDSSQKTLVIDSSGAGTGQEGLHPLPSSVTESEIVGAKFHNARILRGERIDLETLKREIERSIVFHYAGHSTFNEESAGLLVRGKAPGEIAVLDSTAVRSLGPVATRLVALSACSTVAGRSGGFADEDSLSYAFLEKGVPHVVASRWNVDSAVTARLMEQFYDNLLAGLTVGEALRKAELTISSAPATSAPYFWAAFGSYGTS